MKRFTGIVVIGFLFLFFAELFIISPPRAETVVSSGKSDEDILNEMEKTDVLEGEKNRFFKGDFLNRTVCYSIDQADTEGATSNRRVLTHLNRVRFSPEGNIHENISFRCDLDAVFFISNLSGSETSVLFPENTYNDPLHLDYDESLEGGGFFGFRPHRFYAKMVKGKYTITVGRQQIRFGSGRLWNPLDILNPISPTLLDAAENQKGTDALRVEYYPGFATELSVVYAPKRIDDEPDWRVFGNRNMNLVARVKTTFRDVDLAGIAGRTTRAEILGIDAGMIFHDGILRASLLLSDPDQAKRYFMANAGYEYSFRNGIYFLVEYFFTETCLNNDALLAEAWEGVLAEGMNENRYEVLANRFITFNRHYFGMVGGYDITPLSRAELFLIWDVEGKGVYMDPVLKYNLTENLDMALSGIFGAVSEAPDHPSDFMEFSENPMVLFTIQWFF